MGAIYFTVFGYSIVTMSVRVCVLLIVAIFLDVVTNRELSNPCSHMCRHILDWLLRHAHCLCVLLTELVNPLVVFFIHHCEHHGRVNCLGFLLGG